MQYALVHHSIDLDVGEYYPYKTGHGVNRLQEGASANIYIYI